MKERRLIFTNLTKVLQSLMHL